MPYTVEPGGVMVPVFTIYRGQTDGKFYSFMWDSGFLHDEEKFREEPNLFSPDAWVPLTKNADGFSGEFYPTSDKYPFTVSLADDSIQIKMSEKLVLWGFIPWRGTSIYLFKK